MRQVSVQISWLLRQRDLRLSHRGGPERSGAAITFAQATELTDPSPWLSGGELILTTGLGFDSDGPALAQYVRTLRTAGVACLGFGTGLSHSLIPRELLDAADEVGLPVVEVPYDTPFAAVIRAVTTRIAEQEYEEVLRAASVQSRITRAALHGGVDAIVRELAVATSTSVALIGHRTESFHPVDAADLIAQAREIAASIRPSSSPATVSVSEPGRTVSLHSVPITASAPSFLAIRTKGPVTGVEQILLGHAVSLITLELEKPARLRAEQTALNSRALGLLLDGHLLSPGDTHVPSYLADAADDDSRITVVVLRGATGRTGSVADAVDAQFRAHARPTFVRSTDDGTELLLPGDDATFVAQLMNSLPRSVCAGVGTDMHITEAPPRSDKRASRARRPVPVIGSSISPGRCCWRRNRFGSRCVPWLPSPSPYWPSTTALTPRIWWVRFERSWKPTGTGKPPLPTCRCIVTPCATASHDARNCWGWI
ncbi:Purine catabolism regulatory protein [Rhodococcoides fascians D188]|nr:Purine catabolism regulatory protein [Rhodococcus fascians D188]